jgi:amino acid transporter
MHWFPQTTGGPAVMVWGWVVVACMTMLVGLSMAEICSAHPTSGGPYFWYTFAFLRDAISDDSLR